MSFPLRLRAARKMAGLSMEQLAGRLGGLVTKQAIGKYEKGLMKPSAEVLQRLSNVLDVPAEISPVLASPDSAGWLTPESPPVSLASRVEAPERPDVDKKTLAADLAYGPGRAPGEVLSPGDRLSRLSREPAEVAYLTEELLEEGSAEIVCRRDGLRRPPAQDRESAAAGRGGIFDPGSVRFRERRPLPAKLESSLKHRIADYVGRLFEVEATLGSRVVFRNPVEGLSLRTPWEVERAAASVREAWGLGSGPVVNLLGLLEARGIGVCEVRGVDDFDGLSARLASRCIVVVNRDRPADRLRFTAAHELAHLLGDFGRRESAESLCHRFAAAFLLPRPALERVMTPAGRKVTLWDLAEIKESYGISIQAIMSRALALEFVTDRQFRHFRETFRANGWLETEPVEYRGAERAVRLRRLLNYAVAENILGLDRAAALAGATPDEFRKDMGSVF